MVKRRSRSAHNAPVFHRGEQQYSAYRWGAVQPQCKVCRVKAWPFRIDETDPYDFTVRLCASANTSSGTFLEKLELL